ncbi:hypothetical protein IFR04_014873 [Cadophora malorum]|uniref:Uncharacterized protein n=1 Tax=Cadophora malorum TaxID=108018 RepID=A0A8H7VZ30_9HELO|nr:hypothetical protein IFR04_014873 [Cadophora malorum]
MTLGRTLPNGKAVIDSSFKRSTDSKRHKLIDIASTAIFFSKQNPGVSSEFRDGPRSKP